MVRQRLWARLLHGRVDARDVEFRQHGDRGDGVVELLLGQELQDLAVAQAARVLQRMRPPGGLAEVPLSPDESAQRSPRSRAPPRCEYRGRSAGLPPPGARAR